MNQTQAQSRWTLPSSYTLVATRVALGTLLMVAFYLLVSYGPTLVDAHALLYRFFETGAQARTAIANFVIYFSLVMQVVLALACAHVGKALTGNEKLEHGGLVLLWLLHPFVLYLATFVLSLAVFEPTALKGESSPNWAVFGTLVVLTVVFLVATFFPLCQANHYTKKNLVMSLALGKMLPLFLYATVVPSKVTLTLVLGSYALDYLLNSVGDKIQETTA